MKLIPGFRLWAFCFGPVARPHRRAVRSRRSALAALLCGFALVIAAQLGLGIAVETTRPEWRDPEYGHRLKQLRALVHAHPDRPLVVAVGSSRTQMGFSPADMGFPDEPGSPLVYNFGQAGAGPLYLNLTVTRLLDAGVKPRFLLVELLPSALVADGPAEDLAPVWGPRLGLHDLHRLQPYCDDPTILRRAWAANRLVPWFTQRRVLLSHWQPRWLPPREQLDYQWTLMDPFGFLPCPLTDVTAEDRTRHIQDAAREHAGHLRDFRIGAASDRALRDLLARCRREGIPTALYLTPEGPTFRSWYPAQTRQTLSDYVKQLTAAFRVPVFDATDGFAEEEFFDSHHLLRAGAARFSRRLADEHLRAWMRHPLDESMNR